MHIGTFAGYARRLEETSRRTALVAVLAKLFAAATPDDVAPATYLLQGRVAPAFVPLELGMGVVLVTEAVARAFHTEPALVRERFDRVGDLGIVAAQLAEEAGLVSFRDADKRPEDATTVAEIIALYQQQGGTPTPRTARTAAR
jgi:DNA ligase N terminus